MSRLFYILLLVIFVSCTSEEEEYWIEFKVHEGYHYFFATSNLHEKRLEEKVNNNMLEFKASFHKSCLYDTVGFGNDIHDQNKLFGITLNGSDPLKGSVMFAWNYMSDGFINITGFYNRTDKTHMYERNGIASDIVQIYPDTIYDYRIELGDTMRWFINEQQILKIPKEEMGEENDLQFYTLPWFGGQQEAPSGMTIYVHLPF